MQEHLNVAATVCLHFLIQGICLASLTVLLKKNSSLQWLECAAGSLALHQVLKISLMVGTSFFHSLSYIYASLYGLAVFLLFCTAFFAAFCDASFRSSFSALEFESIFKAASLRVFICGALFVAFLLLFVVRAVYFTDNLFDVENYGYSKIAFYFQNNSIFHITGLKDLRIDSFERNGELNFLHSFLLIKDFRFLGLSGVEVWLGILFACYFLLRSLSVEKEVSLILSLLIGCSPVVYGLSGITKGDSWAIFHLVCATGFLVGLMHAGFSNSRFFFFLVFLAAAATSKMTSSFAVVLLLALGLISSAKKIKVNIKILPLLASIAACLVVCNKQIQNIWVFKNPFQLDAFAKEHSGFRLENLIGGFPDFLKWLLGLQGDLAFEGWQNDTLKGMGFVYLVILSCLSLIPLFKQKGEILRFNSKEYAPILCISAVCLIGATLVTLYIENQNENFKGWCRFLSPYFIALACLLFALIFRLIQSNRKLLFFVLAIALLATAYHWVCSLKTSTTLSHKGKRDLLERIVRYDRFQSRFGLEFGPGPISESLYRNHANTPVRMVVYTLMYNCPYSWVFGDNFTWHVTVTDNKNLLIDLSNQDVNEYIAITYIDKNQSIDTQLESLNKILKNHYRLLESTDFVSLYQRL